MEFFYFIIFLNFIYFFFFWPLCTACGILIPQAGIEPGPLAVKAPSPNHWTTREFPNGVLLKREIWTQRQACTEGQGREGRQGEDAIHLQAQDRGLLQTLPSHSSEGTNPADTLTSDSWPPELETINFCSLSPPVCGILLLQL